MSIHESRWLIHYWFNNIDKRFSFIFYQYEDPIWLEPEVENNDPEFYNGEYLVQARDRPGDDIRHAEVDVHSDDCVCVACRV